MNIKLNSALLCIFLTGVLATAAPKADAGVPNVFSPSTPARSSEVNENFSNLDTRVGELELNSGSVSSEQGFVTVDCDTTPNFFTEAPFTTTSAPNTTYDILGTCNGPVLIRDNGVRLNAGSTESTIILPAGLTFETIPIEFLVAVYVFGANDVEINNLRLDATAFNVPAFDGANTGAIYVRNGFATLNNATVQGGAFTIAAFDNATITSNGPLAVADFQNEGFSASQQSNIIVQGSVNFTSSNIPGEDSSVISAFNDGNIDIRGNISITSAAPTTNIFAGENSYISIRDGNDETFPGDIIVEGNSRLRVENITIAASVFAQDDAVVDFDNVRQIGEEGEFIIDDSRVRISNPASDFAGVFDMNTNSSLRIGDTTITGTIFVRGGSFFSAVGSTIEGLNLDNSRANIESATVNGQLEIRNGSTLRLLGSSHNTIDQQGLGVSGNSTAIISNGSITNNIEVSMGSYLNLQGVDQLGSFQSFNVNNSRATLANSTIGNYVLSLGSNVEVSGGQVAGAMLFSGSTLSVDSTSVNGSVGLFNSGFNATGTGTAGGGTFNGNTVFLCSNELSVSIDGLDLSASPTTPIGLAASGIISTACIDGSAPPVSPPSGFSN